MLTRRDALVAVIAAAVTAGGFAVAQSGTAKGSWVINWDDVPAKTTESGSVRSLYNGPTATLKNLDVHITTLNPGGAPHPPHKHPNEEMLIIKSGTVEALINGEWKKVGPGGVIFLASDIFHGVRNVGKEPAVYHVIGFKTADTPAGQAVTMK
ncbi:cupin domain-containing protein [Occallatibacter riparius]|uniref:Cupin domain-containing protein n=1 Tax=Occallatibacter riparius TaxID=1002689 RepID=A0A9J7BVK6_9BACT|nr:cupin domain-containing protein [Occallatibacter riparius]UWZ85818.1 cupin domain-containing protein [Occallatibacter riparius]